jgi:large subunit ribosomal protein L17
MRHLRKVNKLSRKSAHRKAMLANMACSLIKHKGIVTTVAKAKALRKYVEPLLTRAKSDNTHSRRMVFSYLSDKEVVTELFRDVALKIADRPGGYTRILKMGFRKGDNADMCRIELVDYNELMMSSKKEDKKAKTARRGRSSKRKSVDATASAETTTIAQSNVNDNIDDAKPVSNEDKPSDNLNNIDDEPKNQGSDNENIKEV